MKFPCVLQKFFCVVLYILLVGDVAVVASFEDYSTCPKLSLVNGVVRHGNRKYNKLARLTCKKGFTLIGEKFAMCKNGVWNPSSAYCSKPGCVLFPNLENGMQFYMNYNAVVMFFCNPGYDLIGSMKTYCNGTSWNTTQPTCTSTKRDAISLTCDFENPDLCGWAQDPKHDFDWIRKNLKTPSGHIGTGPSYDHTLGEGKLGYYMYIESSVKNENDTARLLSPIFPSNLTRNGCFVFYYHMYGRTTGALKVYVHPENLDFNAIMNDSLQKQKYTMFEKRGNQGNMWYRGFFDLDEMNTNFQIIIEGIRGPGYVSDIAIDDVKILQSEQCVEIRAEQQTAVVPLTVPLTDSCLNRCGVATNDTDDKDNGVCQCTVGCIILNTCCVDYKALCLFNDWSTNSYDSTDTMEEASSLPPILPTPLKKTATEVPTVDDITTELATVKDTIIQNNVSTQKMILTLLTKPTTMMQKKIISTTTAIPTTTTRIVKNLPVVTKPVIITKTVAVTKSATVKNLPKTTVPIKLYPILNNQSTKTAPRVAVPIYFTNDTMYDVVRLNVTKTSDELATSQNKTAIQTTTTNAANSFSKHYGHYGRDDNGKIQNDVEIITTTKSVISTKMLQKITYHQGDKEEGASQALSVTTIILILLLIVFVISAGTIIKLGVAGNYYARVSNGFVSLRQRWTRTNSLSSSQPDMRFLVQDEELENYID
ncbi:uncharacterized protein LOC143912816 isoform X2 [Arctopsyche grandis]|uniref:uncharacterized protein LOC143912816 isoform X2 n=2 Tax=Arctopsyche grandis TaxID=121162 RepID=UPI00406D731C